MFEAPARSPDYYYAHREKIIEQRREWRKTHKAQLQEQRRRWYTNNKPKLSKIKLETLTHYGRGKCACVRCGVVDIKALTLDHIVAVGTRGKKSSGVQFYRYLQVRGYPPGYQTLCANCQLIKAFEENEWITARQK